MVNEPRGIPTDQLIAELAGELQPVRRLAAPGLRALGWLLLCGALCVALILRFGHPSMYLARFAVMRTAVETIATGLTAIAATIAAFELSVPDRSARWAWLPLPPFVLWLAASGLGCLQHGIAAGSAGALAAQSAHCFRFIVALSIPLSLGLFWPLRRARPIHPLPVAALGTLAAAASAAFLLQFFHDFDVTVIDLALHLAAVGLIVLIGTALRRPLLDAG